jgi:hypothetical protein
MTAPQHVTARAAHELEAEQTARALTIELNKFKAWAEQWRVDFDVRLDNVGGEYTVTVIGKTGSRGLQKTLTAEEVHYHVAEIETFTKQLALQFLTEILGDVIYGELAPKLNKAFQNVVSLSKSSL